MCIPNPHQLRGPGGGVWGGGGLHSRELFLVLGLASLIDQHVENENLS